MSSATYSGSWGCLSQKEKRYSSASVTTAPLALLGALLFARRRLWQKVLGGFLAVLGSVAPAGVASSAQGEMVTRTLANGLQIVLVEDPWHPIVALEVCYRVGARHDPVGKQGLAHLLEHLTFPNVSPEGAHKSANLRARATTNQDTTCYRSKLLRTDLERVLAAEAERMATLSLAAQDLAREKAIVVKERQQLVEGDTWRSLLEEVDNVAFRVHPYRFPTIGWPETLAQIARVDVQRHFDAYYSPRNAVLVAVGDFQPQQILVRIETLFGQIPPRGLPAHSPGVEPTQRRERRLLVAPFAPPRFVLAYHVPAFGSPENAVLEVVSALLSGEDTTRLPAVLSAQHLAQTVEVEYSPFTHDPGLFYIKAALGPRVNLRLAGETIDDVLRHLQEEGLRSGELAQAKKRLLLDFYLDQSIDTRATQLAQYAILSALPQGQHYPDHIRAITAADVQRVLGRLFAPHNRVVGITGAAHHEGVRRRQRAAQ